MADEQKTIVEQAKALWAKLTPRKKVTAIAAVGLTLAGTLALALRTDAPKEAVLYGNLPPDDAAAIVKDLEAKKVPYRLEQNGSTILVPEARVHELRLAVSTTSLPGEGGHDLGAFVDKPAPLAGSSFRERVGYQKALSGELSRSITTIDAISRARVILALPEERMFRKDDTPPSASVVVTLKRGRELGKKQIKGIVHVVSSAVERLDPSRVSVVDERGNVLWSGEDTADAEDDQRERERLLTRRISELTDRIVGPGHAVVSVTSELDHSVTEQTEETWDKAGAAVRSENQVEELVQGKSSAAPVAGATVAGGLAGGSSNLPGTAQPPAMAPAAKDTERKKLGWGKNWEIPRTYKHIIGPKGQLKRLHVAVLVDGVPEGAIGATKASTTATSSLAVAKKRVRVWSAAELAQIAALAREAAGLDPSRGDRIEVACAPFFSDDEPIEAPAPTPVWRRVAEEHTLALVGAAAGALLVLAIAAVIVVRRRRRLAAEPVEIPALPLRAAEVDQVLAGEIPGPAPEAEPTLDVRALALEAAKTDPARAARILSAWLAEGGPAKTEAAPAALAPPGGAPVAPAAAAAPAEGAHR